MNFISTFEELNKLYEDVVDSTTAAEYNLSVQKSKDSNQWFVARFKDGAENITAIIIAPDAEEAAKRLDFHYPKATNVDLQEHPIDQKTVARLRTQENAIFVESLDEEADESDVAVAEVADTPADDKEIEIFDDEPKQVIIECDKCGALVIKDEADIVVDEKTDLVNVKDECQFCEEAKGFKIVGVVAPYKPVDATEVEADVIDELDEGIFDRTDDYKKLINKVFKDTDFPNPYTALSMLITDSIEDYKNTMEGEKNGAAFDTIVGTAKKLLKDWEGKPKRDTVLATLTFLIMMYRKIENTSSSNYVDLETYKKLFLSLQQEEKWGTKAQDFIAKQAQGQVKVQLNSLVKYITTSRYESFTSDEKNNLEELLDASVNPSPYNSQEASTELEDEELDEGIFDALKKKKTGKDGTSSAGGKESKVTFTIYNENGTKQFAHTFTEIPGKMSAEEQLRTSVKNNTSSWYILYKKSPNKSDWTYERVSNPPSNFDTKRNRNYFVSDIIF